VKGFEAPAIIGLGREAAVDAELIARRLKRISSLNIYCCASTTSSNGTFLGGMGMLRLGLGISPNRNFLRPKLGNGEITLLDDGQPLGSHRQSALE